MCQQSLKGTESWHDEAVGKKSTFLLTDLQKQATVHPQNIHKQVLRKRLYSYTRLMSFILIYRNTFVFERIK